MNSLFAALYQFLEDIFGMFNQQFEFVFYPVFNNNGYMQMGLMLLLIPLVFLLLFYYVYKNPYATILHWGIWVSIIAIVIGGSTFGAIRLILASLILDPDPAIASFSQNLTIKYAVLNGVLSIVISFLLSLALKQKSRIQMHLPF